MSCYRNGTRLYSVNCGVYSEESPIKYSEDLSLPLDVLILSYLEITESVNWESQQPPLYYGKGKRGESAL